MTKKATFTERLTRIIRGARETGPDLSGSGSPIRQKSSESADNRETLRRLAAAMAVIRLLSDTADPAAAGRRRGSAYASDHRRALLGAPASRTGAERSVWR